MKLQRKMHGDFVVVDGEDVEKLEAENERLRDALIGIASVRCLIPQVCNGGDGRTLCTACIAKKALNGGDE